MLTRLVFINLAISNDAAGSVDKLSVHHEKNLAHLDHLFALPGHRSSGDDLAEYEDL